MVSTEQKAILRAICKDQIESLTEVKEGHSFEIYNDMIEEAYECDIKEIEDHCDKWIAMWGKVYNEPEHYMSLLDYTNLGMVKHHLFNEHLENSPTASKKLWHSIYMMEKFNINLNQMQN